MLVVDASVLAIALIDDGPDGITAGHGCSAKTTCRGVGVTDQTLAGA